MAGSFTGTLFEAGSVFNVPFGSGAQWGVNKQLQGVPLAVNTPGSGYDMPIYSGASTDPLVTVTGTVNGINDTPNGPLHIHIPAGAQPATGSDHHLSVVDGGTLYSMWNFQWTGATTATARYSAVENVNGSGVIDAPTGKFDGSNYDFAVGTITGSDLQKAASSGVINHMLRVAIPTTLAKSYSSNWQQLAPYAGPQTQEDGFGPSVYSGTLPYGVTIGIPKGVAEPADIKANAGANILWNTLQQHGAMVRDTNGTSSNVTLYTDQTVADNNSLVQGMDQYGLEIASQLEFLTNQGASEVNGNAGANWVASSTSGGGGGGGGGPSPSGGGGSGSGGSGGPSPSGTIITPGHGSFTDSAGNAYTLTLADIAMENGSPIPDGGNTAEMEYYNSKVYGEDATSHAWYIWDQHSWTSTAAPPHV